jgi:hypothetical protein
MRRLLVLTLREIVKEQYLVDMQRNFEVFCKWKTFPDRNQVWTLPLYRTVVAARNQAETGLFEILLNVVPIRLT